MPVRSLLEQLYYKKRERPPTPEGCRLQIIIEKATRGRKGKEAWKARRGKIRRRERRGLDIYETFFSRGKKGKSLFLLGRKEKSDILDSQHVWRFVPFLLLLGRGR